MRTGAKPSTDREGSMNKHKEHITFVAIITLVLGGIGLQIMRSDATASQVETIVPVAMVQAHDRPLTAAAP
jgi:hypothetical protein